jgi:hypothetical protein
MPDTATKTETDRNVLQDVREAAEQRFARHVATYRAGVMTMAQTGGTLPAAEAEKMVLACEALGISSDRAADDVSAVIRARNIEARIAAVHERNAAKREPLPRLQQELEAAREEWGKVRVECDQRLKAAEALVTEKTRAYEAVERLRDERSDEDQAALRKIHETNPHLFGQVTPDVLKRMMAPPPAWHPW